MSKYLWFLPFLVLLHNANGGIILWGSQSFHRAALQQCDKVFQDVIKSIGEREIAVFRGKSKEVIESLRSFTYNMPSVYYPNAQFCNTDKIQELTGDQDIDYVRIKKVLRQQMGYYNVIALIVDDDKQRIKRKIDVGTPQTPEGTETPYAEPSEDPVLYSASFPTNIDMGAMIYSSRPPQLKINGTFSSLGAAAVAKMDIRETYTRLIATIPVENGKIALRFKFPWVGGYWSLSSVEVELIGAQSKQFNLTLKSGQEVMAPGRFSYHCGGEFIFSDVENDVELVLLDLQVQPDAYYRCFSDAYNCVPFTTGPLFAGFYVCFPLFVVLVFAFCTLAEIKVLDHFESAKSKQVPITVWE